MLDDVGPLSVQHLYVRCCFVVHPRLAAVLVTEARSGELVMRHVVVGPSPISGQGLFTVERLSPKKLVGAYTGLVEPQLQDSGSGSSSSSEGGGGADDESLMSVKVRHCRALLAAL
jgi:hypothetical protein